jgi:hypothetical protein
MVEPSGAKMQLPPPPVSMRSARSGVSAIRSTHSLLVIATGASTKQPPSRAYCRDAPMQGSALRA